MFTQVCILIAGVISMACSQHEQVYPIGDCEQYGSTLVCYVDEDDVRIRAQAYLPHTCEDNVQNINCFYDDSGKSTGDFLGDLTPTEQQGTI